MSKVIEAVYEDGVFKPIEKVALKEGERIKIEIKEYKKVTKRFYNRLSKIKKKSVRISNAYRVLEDVRSDSC